MRFAINIRASLLIALSRIWTFLLQGFAMKTKTCELSIKIPTSLLIALSRIWTVGPWAWFFSVWCVRIWSTFNVSRRAPCSPRAKVIVQSNHHGDTCLALAFCRFLFRVKQGLRWRERRVIPKLEALDLNVKWLTLFLVLSWVLRRQYESRRFRTERQMIDGMVSCNCFVVARAACCRNFFVEWSVVRRETKLRTESDRGSSLIILLMYVSY
jgi:hypothetical protein